MKVSMRSCHAQEGGGGGEEEDLGKVMRNRYANSAAPEHRHLCAVAAAMSHLLKHEGLPPLSTAYFAATMNSIDTITQDDQGPQVTTALCTFLSLILCQLRCSFLTSKAMPALDVLLSLHTHQVQAQALAPGAIKSIMKCVASLLSAAAEDRNCRWPLLAPSFNLLLNYSLDKRPKVRRCGQECLEQVLNSFQGSLVLGKASKCVYTLFKQCLPSGNKGRTQVDTVAFSEELKVLHVLNTLKLILPLLCTKVIYKILPCLKVLVDIRQPLLMRHIISALQALCTSGSADIPAGKLADVLDSISLSISSCEKKPSDETMFAANFLKYGMQKLHMLDRNLCAAKLPSVFHSVAGILASENKEAVSCAGDTLKGLIFACIDESMVLEGVKHVNTSNIHCEDQTPIERVCSSAEIILDKHHGSTSNIAFQVIADLFTKLGESSSSLMESSLKRLSNFQKLPTISLQSREQLHRCVGSAVSAMGPDKFLCILPLNFAGEDLIESDDWLLPVLKQHIVGAHLQFFILHIFPMARNLLEKSRKLSQDGITSQKTEAYIHSLWDLLPSFCNYPVDTAESFGPLAHIMIDALKKEPKLHSIITSSLQILVKQNKDVQTENANAKDGCNMSNCASASEGCVADERAKAHYTKKVASKNIKVIAFFAGQFLLVLSKIFLLSSQDKRKELQATIGCIASVTKQAVVKDIFVSLVQKHQITQDPTNVSYLNKDLSTQPEGAHNEDMKASDRCTLLDLGLPLIHAFGEDEIQILFTVAKSGLQDHDGLAQEKAYNVLSSIFKEHMWFLPQKFCELVELMRGVKDLHDVSIKRRRLECLHHLILYILKRKGASASDTALTLIGETILTLKHSNKEISRFTYEILVEIGNGLNDASSGGSNEDLMSLFNVIVGYLVGTSPHMISAAVAGLARLVYEYSDFCLKVPNLLPSALLLLHSKSREVVKATLGFMKVVATRLQAEDLKKYLPDIIEGLLLWSDDSKNHFKLKVHVVLEILIRKCGSGSVSDIMPQKHMELFKSIMRPRKEKMNWNKACFEDPEAGESFYLHTEIERSSSAPKSKKRRHEESPPIGQSKDEICHDSTLVTKRQWMTRRQRKHCRGTRPHNSTDGSSHVIIRNSNVVKDKKSASRRRVQIIRNSEANVSQFSVAKSARQKKS